MNRKFKAVLLLFFACTVFCSAYATPTMCETYKSQLYSLCSAKPQEQCVSSGDIDPDLPGNDCEWNANKSQCVLKAGLNWAETYSCGGRDRPDSLGFGRKYSCGIFFNGLSEIFFISGLFAICMAILFGPGRQKKFNKKTLLALLIGLILIFAVLFMPSLC
jgi:hypothetical protein